MPDQAQQQYAQTVPHSNAALSSSSFTSNKSAGLPQYRATPDYETVMRQRMERLAQQQQQQQAHHNIDRQVHGVANIGSAQVYTQPEMMAYSQPEIRHTQNYTGHLHDQGVHIDQLDKNSICRNLLREAGMTQQVQLRQHVPTRPVDRTSSLIIHPTYSTPELHLNPLPNPYSTSEQLISEVLLNHYKPPPPYPRSSSSTPDLASQTARAQASSSPDLVSKKNLIGANTGSQQQFQTNRSWENIPESMQELQIHQQQVVQTTQVDASQPYVFTQQVEPPPPPYCVQPNASIGSMQASHAQQMTVAPNIVYGQQQQQVVISHTPAPSVNGSMLMNLTAGTTMYASPPSSPTANKYTSQPDVLHHQQHVLLQQHQQRPNLPTGILLGDMMPGASQIQVQPLAGPNHISTVPFRTVHTANSSHSSGTGSDSLTFPPTSHMSLPPVGLDPSLQDIDLSANTNGPRITQNTQINTKVTVQIQKSGSQRSTPGQLVFPSNQLPVNQSPVRMKSLDSPVKHEVVHQPSPSPVKDKNPIRSPSAPAATGDIVVRRRPKSETRESADEAR